MITFNNALTTDDYLVVTATKYNYDGYIGSVQVGEGPAGLVENTAFDLNVYPNPTKDNAFVSLNMGESAMVNITVTDISGKVVTEIINAQLPAGNQQYTISTTAYQAGVYFVNVSTNDARTVRKLTVIK